MLDILRVCVYLLYVSLPLDLTYQLLSKIEWKQKFLICSFKVPSYFNKSFWMKNNPSSTLCPTMMGLVSNDFTHRSQLYLSVLQRLMTLKEGKFFWASSTCWAVCWVLESYIQIRSNPCHQGRPIP